MPPGDRKKLTVQPRRRHHFVPRPGAAPIDEPSSDDDSEESEEEEKEEKKDEGPKPWRPKPAPPPKVTSFPSSAQRAIRQKSEAERKKLEEEYETESEAGSGKPGSATGSESGSGSDSEEDSEEESSSEEEVAPRKLLRPVFMKKNQRDKVAATEKSQEQIAEEAERRKQEEAKVLLREQIERAAAEKAAAKKAFDDDTEAADINAIDDTDDVDPEAEYAAWKLRELKRIKRERVAIEEKEAELAELERRRNLTEAEREAEDRAFIEKQKDEQGDRGQMQFMQKYFHKGAFFQEDLKELGVDRRNVMGARFEDATNREILPEYMQIRDMTKLGKKGRTRYRDMKNEDTGRWGDFGDVRKRRDDYDVDERFRSDSYRGGDREGATGANARPLGERKRFGEESHRDGKRPRVDER